MVKESGEEFLHISLNDRPATACAIAFMYPRQRPCPHFEQHHWPHRDAQKHLDFFMADQGDLAIGHRPKLDRNAAA